MGQTAGALPVERSRSSPIGEAGHEQGYTLVEMLVVLTVVGLLLAGVPAVMSAGRAGVEARTSAQTLADDLNAARISAIADNQETGVVFDLMHKSYVVEPGVSVHKLPQTLSLEFRDATESLHDTRANSAIIRFFPDGSTTGGVIKLSIKGETHFVEAHAITGRISIDE